MSTMLRGMVPNFDHMDKHFIGIQNNQVELMNMIQEMHSTILNLAKSNDEIKEKIRKMKHVERTIGIEDYSPQISTKNSK